MAAMHVMYQKAQRLRMCKKVPVVTRAVKPSVQHHGV